VKVCDVQIVSSFLFGKLYIWNVLDARRVPTKSCERRRKTRFLEKFPNSLISEGRFLRVDDSTRPNPSEPEQQE